MVLDNLNRWLALAVNAGVLAGIVFLAMKVDQNSRMMKTRTRNGLLEDAEFQAERQAWHALLADPVVAGTSCLVTRDLRRPSTPGLTVSCRPGLVTQYQFCHPGPTGHSQVNT